MTKKIAMKLTQRLFRVYLVVFAFMFLVACGAQVDLSKPPEIFYGEDLCVECGMIISDRRFAAAYYPVNGDTKLFDDIGGMAIHHAEQQEQIAQFWVHDFDTEEWIKADQAFFVMSEEIHSPMDYGIIAFSDETRAKEFASENDAMVMSFDAIIDSVKNGSNSHDHSDS